MLKIHNKHYKSIVNELMKKVDNIKLFLLILNKFDTSGYFHQMIPQIFIKNNIYYTNQDEIINYWKTFILDVQNFDNIINLKKLRNNFEYLIALTENLNEVKEIIRNIHSIFIDYGLCYYQGVTYKVYNLLY